MYTRTIVGTCIMPDDKSKPAHEGTQLSQRVCRTSVLALVMQHQQCSGIVQLTARNLEHRYEPAIQRVQEHLLTFRVRRICCHSHETHAPIAKSHNNAQLKGTTPNNKRYWVNIGPIFGILA